MLRVHAALVRELDAELDAAHGLPLSSYDVLIYLRAAPGKRLRMAELADSVLLSRSGVTRLVDRLEREGLIVRDTCDVRRPRQLRRADRRGRGAARARAADAPRRRARALPAPLLRGRAARRSPASGSASLPGAADLIDRRLRSYTARHRSHPVVETITGGGVVTIVRWEPLRELSSLQTEMNRLFNAVFDAPASGSGGSPPLDAGDGPRSRPRTTSSCAPTCPA